MIDPILWNTEISTGIFWQDYQHKELIGRINTLREKISAGENTNNNIELIDFLVFYTNDHLSIEEGYMDLLKYPDAEQHKKQHKEFLNKIDDLKNLSSFSVGIKTEALYQDLAGWFFKHIKNTDQRFGVFLKDNGIK
jgi:hemerythrin